MRKIGGFAFWAGLILIIGPFFGITLKGFSGESYGTHFLTGVIALAISFAISYFTSNSRNI